MPSPTPNSSGAFDSPLKGIDQIVDAAYDAAQFIADTYHFQPGAYKRDYDSPEYWQELSRRAFQELIAAYNAGYRDGSEGR